MNEFAPWLPLLGCVLGFLCLLGALRAGKRRRLVDNLPTSKTTGVFIGLVELKGSVEIDSPLRSFLAECRCAQYSWGVEEHWQRTVTETYTDSEGKMQTRTRTESGWTTVASGGELIPFYLNDDCGAVLVRPEGAEIEALSVFDQTCTSWDPLYYGKGPAGGIAHSTGRRHFHEHALPLHTPIYVMGQSREREDVVAPEIAADKSAPLFLISTRSEQQISSGFAWAFWGWLGFGLVLAVGGFVWRDGVQGRDLQRQWPVYLLPLLGFSVTVALGWVWMVFNSLVDLRQRVRQGWAQVDVQLKRRFDLIPNLVATVTGLRDHEAKLQESIALLRAQQTATPPGVAGPDYAACTKVIVAVREAYPELTAQPAFLDLQKSLVDTEHRIALARGYFNEIATYYNTRMEVIPDRFVAALGGLLPQPLMSANDFEREPVGVQFMP
ncbi:MAG: LemA family protein [Limisphaerales bacterium]